MKIDHIFSSADYDVALEFIGYCRMFAEVFNELAGEKLVDTSTWTRDTAYFPNGARIIAKSSNPKGFRGFRGDVTLDEIAWHEQAEECYKAAQPCLVWDADAEMHLVSSHSSQEHFFYRLCREIESGKRGKKWMLNRVTIEDAVRDGFALKVPGQHQQWLSLKGPEYVGKAFLNDLRAGCASEADYQQEYMCQPNTAAALFKSHEYDACAIWHVPDFLSVDTAYGDLFVGIDVGRTNDLTVVWVLERGYVGKKANPNLLDHLRDVYRTVAVVAMKNTDFPKQLARIRELLANQTVSKMLVDMGSVGRGLAEDLVREFGEQICEPYAVTATRKGQALEKARQFVQQRRISLPPDDACKASFLAVHKAVTEKGNVTYDGRTSNDHCDFPMACGLALEATGAATAVTMNQIEFKVERDPFHEIAVLPAN